MSKKKNILFIAEELDTNGAMISLVALLKALQFSNYNLSLFLFKHGGRLVHEIPSNVSILPESIKYQQDRVIRRGHHHFPRAKRNSGNRQTLYRSSESQ